MAENLFIPSDANKADIYEAIVPQISALIASETSRIAALANVSAVLKSSFNFFWVGFYLVEDNQLVLGPFQGPLACSRIKLGRGVCGSAWLKAETILVDDVELFDGHIACSSDSKSEIVVPIFNGTKVVGVLDVDSNLVAAFDNTDRDFLEKICANVGQICF